MNYLVTNIKQTWLFMKQSRLYFSSVMLLHLFILLIFAPMLVTATRFILMQGSIPYLSYDTVGPIVTSHPFVLFSLLAILIILLFALYLEFTFLLLSMYYIQIRKKVSLKQLIKETISKIKQLEPIHFLFFLFYFLLISPISGIQFNSELLSKIKIPVFMMDFLFENRLIFIIMFFMLYGFFIYLGIRLIFVLPLMILNEYSFKVACVSSWKKTRQYFFNLLGQFVFTLGAVAVISGGCYWLIIYIQHLFDKYQPNYSLAAAVVLLSLLQIIWVFQLILSTVAIFFVTLTFMGTNGWLKIKKPDKYHLLGKKKTVFVVRFIRDVSIFGLTVWLLFGVGSYNLLFLEDVELSEPITISHRGVDNYNHVQNTIEALALTSQTTSPDFIEMDIQETKDHEFVVYHDFDLKNLAGVSQKPFELELAELTDITISEKDKEAKIASFNDYFEMANSLNQKLLIEIKPTKQDSEDMVDHFIALYGDEIIKNGHEVQSLSFDIVEELKEKAPDIRVGYIMPFSLTGPPVGLMDFYSIEYTTLNSRFVQSAHELDKEVYVWTPNDSETIDRMMFYGVDGIITDRMSILNETKEKKIVTYADKLVYFLIGIG